MSQATKIVAELRARHQKALAVFYGETIPSPQDACVTHLPISHESHKSNILIKDGARFYVDHSFNPPSLTLVEEVDGVGVDYEAVLNRYDQYDQLTRCRNVFKASQGKGPCRNVCHCDDNVMDKVVSKAVGVRVAAPLRPLYYWPEASRKTSRDSLYEDSPPTWA